MDGCVSQSLRPKSRLGRGCEMHLAEAAEVVPGHLTARTHLMNASHLLGQVVRVCVVVLTNLHPQSHRPLVLKGLTPLEYIQTG